MMTVHDNERSNVHERTLLVDRTASDEEQATTSPLKKSLSDDNEEASSSSPGQQKAHSRQVMVALRQLVLLLCNVVAWYITNGMNGIAMQEFSAHIRSYRTAGKEDLMSNIANIAVVTGCQLAFGVAIGVSMLWIFSIMSSYRIRIPLTVPTRQEAILASLHSIGSICTNLGFTYGSASLIQILKLLEPFETLVLSQLLLPQDGKFTIGVISSMLFVVGAAVSLIRIRPTKPHPHAVVFAIFSGLSLSWRNVMQRQQHVQASAVAVSQQHDDSNRQLSKVERSVELFTKLSFHSAIMTFLWSIPLNAILLATSTEHSNVVKMELAEALNWRVMTWHPLYNTFSMITLGFCSALTHSLLNAGKRVFAIVMAIVWFREGFTIATLLGLVAVAGGGCWYTLEAKANKKKQQSTSMFDLSRWIKLVISVSLLHALFRLQSVRKVEQSDVH